MKSSAILFQPGPRRPAAHGLRELIGDFKNAGREWQPKGMPEPVRIYDFIDPTLGKVAPYGVYDIAANQGSVSEGITHDTAEFAVETIRRWWRAMGRPLDESLVNARRERRRDPSGQS